MTSLEGSFPDAYEGAEAEIVAEAQDADEQTPVFRSKYPRSATAGTGRGIMAESPPAPDAKVRAEERKYVVRELLVRYAQESDENAHCARLIRLRYFLAWDLMKIITYVYGTPASTRQQKAWERHIYRDMAHDYEELRMLLQRDFGITGLWQV
jgi:hypothetical protein